MNYDFICYKLTYQKNFLVLIMANLYAQCVGERRDYAKYLPTTKTT